MTRKKIWRIHDIEAHIKKINDLLIVIGEPSSDVMTVFGSSLSAGEVTVIIEALRRRRDSLAKELDNM